MAPTQHRIDEAHRQLIRPGMTLAEVEAVFGVPPSVYDRLELLGTRDDPIVGMRTDEKVVRVALLPEPVTIHWGSRHGVFFVHFDDHGRVRSVSAWYGGRPITEPAWTRWWRKAW